MGVGENPLDRELHRRHAARLRVGGDVAGDLQALGAELGLHHAPVATPRAGAGGGRLAGRVFAAQHAARGGAVGDDRHAVTGAGGEYLHLGLAVHRVVVGLAGDGLVDAELAAQPDDLGVAPRLEVGQREVADLAGADGVAHRRHRFLERRVRILAVPVIDVDPVRPQAPEAGVEGALEPAPRQAAGIGLAGVEAVARLGGEHPVGAPGRDQAAHDLLRRAAVIDVGGVDEVHPGVEGGVDDSARLRLVRLAAEHHRSQAQPGHLEAAAAELRAFHGLPSIPRACPVARPCR